MDNLAGKNLFDIYEMVEHNLELISKDNCNIIGAQVNKFTLDYIHKRGFHSIFYDNSKFIPIRINNNLENYQILIDREKNSEATTYIPYKDYS